MNLYNRTCGGLFTYTHTLRDSSSFYQADCPPVSLSSIHTVFLLTDNISGQKKKNKQTVKTKSLDWKTKIKYFILTEYKVMVLL